MSPQPRRSRVVVEVRRGRLDSVAGFTLLSLIAHVTGMGLILAAASLVPARRPLPPDPGFFVRLADLPPAGGARPAAPAPEKPPAPQPAPPLKHKEILLPAKPKEVLPRRPVVRPQPQRPEATARSEPGTPSASSAPPGVEGPGAPGGVPGGEGKPNGLDIPSFVPIGYTGRVLNRLNAFWRRPDLPGLRNPVIAFVILKDGSVKDVQLETSSGDETVDLLAERAVSNAVPLPPFPPQLQEESVPARMSFEVSTEP